MLGCVPAEVLAGLEAKGCGIAVIGWHQVISGNEPNKASTGPNHALPHKRMHPDTHTFHACRDQVTSDIPGSPPTSPGDLALTLILTLTPTIIITPTPTPTPTSSPPIFPSTRRGRARRRGRPAWRKSSAEMAAQLVENGVKLLN